MYEGDYKFRRRAHFCLLSLSLDVIHILQYRTTSRESSVLEWVAAIINNDKCWKLTHTLSLSLYLAFKFYQKKKKKKILSVTRLA